jgi:hypothetical protein
MPINKAPSAACPAKFYVAKLQVALDVDIHRDPSGLSFHLMRDAPTISAGTKQCCRLTGQRVR